MEISMILVGPGRRKGDERQRREQSENVKEFYPSNNLEISDWKELMKNQSNKANCLTTLLF